MDPTTHASDADTTIEPLVHALSGHDPVPPWSARQALESIGAEAVPSLVEALDHPSPDARWEAAKALAAIAHPPSAPALVAALKDDDGGVRWVASQGLCRIGMSALPALLTALVRHSDSAWLREGAHHVIRVLAVDELGPVLRPVLAAIDGIAPAIAVMAAADRALAQVETRLSERPSAGASGERYLPRGPAIHIHGTWRHLAPRP